MHASELVGSWQDAAGLVGVLIVLLAYAGAALGRWSPEGGLSLAANLAGALLILLSLLTASFNIAAFAMESSWALVSLIGLARLGLRRIRKH